MCKFKTGDIVKCIDKELYDDDVTIGKEYQVTGICTENVVTVLGDDEEDVQMFVNELELIDESSYEIY